ncbi:hypothetical protein SAMN02787149_107219 [Pseudomonas sp. Snoq117.2]|nr:hypothetical protein SAMN02787149_107219 [Pseudomonas sp. Snoq117.2]
MDMKPTNEQKLIILMLADIAEKLGADTHFDLKLVAKAIGYDSAWMLPFEYSMSFENEDLPVEVKDVINVLDMFDFIERGVEGLSPDDQAEIRVVPNGHNVVFRGFDGNNETTHYGIAGHLVNDLKRFSRFYGRDLNSDRLFSMYMAACWRPMCLSVATS